MDELDLIEEIRKQAIQLPQNLILGMGDDAAVFQGPGDSVYLVSTDTYNQGVHFDLGFQTPKQAGFRSLVAAISDIAAMGGTPLFCQFSFAVPAFDETLIGKFLEGVLSAAEDYAISLSGGDVTSIAKAFSLSFTIIGKAHKNEVLLRSSATPGDTIYLTDSTGWAAVGLALLSKRRANFHNKERAIKAFNYPVARVDIGREIARLSPGHGACIDISDGLAQDAHHLAESSRVTLSIKKRLLKRMYPSVFFEEEALYGGEDYQLLISHPLSPRSMAKLAPSLARKIYPIGDVQEFQGTYVFYEDDNTTSPLPNKGWRHS